ncbi:MAG: DUF1127 domain-containing protein [Gammaproteobacteria bacterium]|nr:DUF1127 domain-containing protein [Gammaproteobacteria bacterium]
MKGFIAALAGRVRRVSVWIGYERARQAMLQLPDRTLDDIGVSRALLEQGVSAWPWREQSAKAALLSNNAPLDVKPAIAELRRYGDADLNELGIARSQIETVVVHGRDGVDAPRNAA